MTRLRRSALSGIAVLALSACGHTYDPYNGDPPPYADQWGTAQFAGLNCDGIRVVGTPDMTGAFKEDQSFKVTVHFRVTGQPSENAFPYFFAQINAELIHWPLSADAGPKHGDDWTSTFDSHETGVSANWSNTIFFLYDNTTGCKTADQ